MSSNKAVSVVVAAVGINLVANVLYAWSIFKEAIGASVASGSADGFHWSTSSINDPYALCCLVFAFAMVPAGRLQDTIGSRKTALLGGVLGGTGFFLIANSVDYWTWMLGFGGLVGAGIGFAYASATPVALRWFPPHKTPTITGMVVSGFALASLYVAPLASHLVINRDLHSAMLYFSAHFFLLIALFSVFLVRPPAGYIPWGSTGERRGLENDRHREEFVHLDENLPSPLRAIRQPQFWVLWMLFFIGAGAGLMVIGNIKGLAKLSMGELAYLAIAILAVGDAIGRIMTGKLSSKYGRGKVLTSAFLLQTLLMFIAFPASQSGSALYIVPVATLIGLSYGANLVLFPSYVKDFWGMKHFGMIYGMLFTAWGIGGFSMVKLAEYLNFHTGSNHMTFMVAGSLVLVGVFITRAVDNRKDIERAAWRKAKATSDSSSHP